MTKKSEAKAEAVAKEHTPDLAEAKEMFAGNPGLAAVLTTEGMLHRDGNLDTSMKPGE